MASTTIEKIGFDDEIPTISEDTLPNAEYLTKSLDSISIDINKNTGLSIEKTFYIWWYLYTTNEFSIKCNATNWKGATDGNRDLIQFDASFAESDGSGLGKLVIEAEENATTSDVKIYQHDKNGGLNVGYAAITIHPFDYLEKTKDSYSTTISFTFTSV